MLKIFQKIMGRKPTGPEKKRAAVLRRGIELEKDKLSNIVDHFFSRATGSDLLLLHKIMDPIIADIIDTVDMDSIEDVAAYRAFFCLGYLSCRIQDTQRREEACDKHEYDA